MLIHGIGTDIVRIARMEDNVDRYGARFARRMLAPEEMKEYELSRQPARFLAKRFAAKEAAAKALGTGFSQGVGLRDIAVAHEAAGRLLLVYSGGRGAFYAMRWAFARAISALPTSVSTPWLSLRWCVAESHFSHRH